MLALNHVTLATASILGVSLYLDQPFFLPFIVFVVFAALLPDIDHPNSEISNFFPYFNKLFPHRQITHSFLGVGVFAGGLYFLLGYSTILSIILLVAAFIGVHFLGKLMNRRIGQLKHVSGGFFSSKQIKLAVKIFELILNGFLISLLFLIWKDRFRLEILILLVFGYAAHIVGDFVTIEGVPLFFPIKLKQGLKLFRTGGNIESFIGVVLLFVNAYLIYKFWIQFDLSSTQYWVNYLGL
jgi:membrane-bound metal-dependent hydrolase YbcI (DUF457 family)